MSNVKDFARGVEFISTIYRERLNGKPFDRNEVVKVTKSLKRMGFIHSYNKGSMAYFVQVIHNCRYIIQIGRLGGENYYNMDIYQLDS